MTVHNCDLQTVANLPPLDFQATDTNIHTAVPLFLEHLQGRNEFSSLIKREKTWPQKEVGVMIVFCILFVIGAALIGVFLARLFRRYREDRELKKSAV